MNDPVYQPPNTDPSLSNSKPVKPPEPPKSNTRLLLLTFTPSALLLISIFLIEINENIFLFFLNASPIIAFLCVTITTVEQAKGKTTMNGIFILILTAAIHFTLLFLTVFIGCGVTGNTF